MAYPCQDCGKVLATQGGLDVHRAQWCSGTPGDPAPPARRGRLRRRDRGRRARESKHQPAVPGPEPDRVAPDLVPIPGGRGRSPARPAADAPLDGASAFDGAGGGAPTPTGAEVVAGSDPEPRPEPEDEPVDLLAPAIDLRDGEGRVELSLIMWLMRRRVHVDRLPRDRTVVRFDFTGSGHESYWLVLEPPDVGLLATEPRHGVDLVVTADALAFKRVFQGRMLLADALGDGHVSVEGPEALAQSLPRWFEWSQPLAPAGDRPV